MLIISRSDKNHRMLGIRQHENIAQLYDIQISSVDMRKLLVYASIFEKWNLQTGEKMAI